MTGEFISSAPTSKAVRIAETLKGALTFKDFLDEAQMAQIEEVLAQCAKEADFQVNTREYPKEGYPSDKECNRLVGTDSQGNPIKRAMELGKMKHDAAFACVERRMGREFSSHVTREPRYSESSYTLTQDGPGTLVPDVVIHWLGNANKVHRLDDFFFPCTARGKSDPLASQGKLDKYKPLVGDGRRALVTPQLGISR
ncbi:hypothetical protein [Melittangium boletus]|uniref:hypothetical protein n=1 Tax=Melittangium boletus TaxID=83453 RepID=UPI003DA1DEAF